MGPGTRTRSKAGRAALKDAIPTPTQEHRQLAPRTCHRISPLGACGAREPAEASGEEAGWRTGQESSGRHGAQFRWEHSDPVVDGRNRPARTASPKRPGSTYGGMAGTASRRWWAWGLLRHSSRPDEARAFGFALRLAAQLRQSMANPAEPSARALRVTLKRDVRLGRGLCAGAQHQQPRPRAGAASSGVTWPKLRQRRRRDAAGARLDRRAGAALRASGRANPAAYEAMGSALCSARQTERQWTQGLAHAAPWRPGATLPTRTW